MIEIANEVAKYKFVITRKQDTRRRLQANKRARRLWPLDFVDRKSQGYYAMDGKRLRFNKRGA